MSKNNFPPELINAVADEMVGRWWDVVRPLTDRMDKADDRIDESDDRMDDLDSYTHQLFGQQLATVSLLSLLLKEAEVDIGRLARTARLKHAAGRKRLDSKNASDKILEQYETVNMHYIGLLDVFADFHYPIASNGLAAIQMVYAIPSDQTPQEQYVEAVGQAAISVQKWYAKQLGGVSFGFTSNMPDVYLLDHPSEYYEGKDGRQRILSSLASKRHKNIPYPNRQVIQCVYIDADIRCDGSSELGTANIEAVLLHRGDLTGLRDQSYQLCGAPPRGAMGWVGGLAHMLGLALGLQSIPSGNNHEDSLMGSGFYWNYPATYLSKSDADKLLQSPFINNQLFD